MNSKKANLSEEEDFYFDDCLICQGMKKAKDEGRELKLEELTELFANQNAKNKNG